MIMLPSGTYSVSQLAEELREILEHTLHGVWVAGEVRRPVRSRAGHLYFELVEKDDGDSVRGVLQSALFRRDLQRVDRVLRRSGLDLTEGQQVRCFGGLDFYPPSGRLQLIVRDIDPLFSLGDLAQRRTETVARLREQGLMELNAGRLLSSLPLRIALLTSGGSAAERDFSATVQASRFGFRVELFDVAVQGNAAERELVGALEQVGSRMHDFDVVALVRGGGSKSDLVAFDSWAVSSAIARCPLPVFSGLGHEIDESVTDLVAHTAFKTPTAVAEDLVRRLERVDAELDARAVRLVAVAARRLQQADHRLTRLELRRRQGQRRLAGAAGRLERLTEALTRASRAALRRHRERVADRGAALRRSAQPPLDLSATRLEDLGARARAGVQQHLEEQRRRLRRRERWVEQLAPERTLRRGFSITRDARGAALRASAHVASGDLLVTELHSGSLESSVTASHPPSESTPRRTGAADTEGLPNE